MADAEKYDKLDLKLVFKHYLIAASLTEEDRQRKLNIVANYHKYFDALVVIRDRAKLAKDGDVKYVSQEEGIEYFRENVIIYKNFQIYSRMLLMNEAPNRNYDHSPKKENFPGMAGLLLNKFTDFYFNSDLLGKTVLKERKEIALSDLVYFVNPDVPIDNELVQKIDACLKRGSDEPEAFIKNKYYNMLNVLYKK